MEVLNTKVLECTACTWTRNMKYCTDIVQGKQNGCAVREQECEIAYWEARTSSWSDGSCRPGLTLRTTAALGSRLALPTSTSLEPLISGRSKCSLHKGGQTVA